MPLPYFANTPRLKDDALLYAFRRKRGGLRAMYVLLRTVTLTSATHAKKAGFHASQSTAGISLEKNCSYTGRQHVNKKSAAR